MGQEANLSLLGSDYARQSLDHVTAAVLLQDVHLAPEVGLDDNGNIHLEVVQKLQHVKAGVPEPDLLERLSRLCLSKHVVFHVLHGSSSQLLSPCGEGVPRREVSFVLEGECYLGSGRSLG